MVLNLFKRKPKDGESEDYSREDQQSYSNQSGNRSYGDGSNNGENRHRSSYDNRSNSERGDNGNRRERTSYQNRDGNVEGHKRPYKKVYRTQDDNGEKRPYQRRDNNYNRDNNGERRPYQRRDNNYNREDNGERRPYQRRDNNYNRDNDGERRPYQRRDNNYNRDNNGERRPYQRRDNNYNRDNDGERRPYQRRDNNYNRDNNGERRPYQRRDNNYNRDNNGERRPYQRRDNNYNRDNDGERRPYQRRDNNYNRDNNSERRPYQRRDNNYNRDNRQQRPYNNRGNNSRPQVRKKSTYVPKPGPDITEPVRLNKFIANTGLCSRREADEYIKAGDVTINDVVHTEMGVRVKPGDVVKYKGAEIKPQSKTYIIMNKPKDFVTTVDDPNAKRTVIDLVEGKIHQRVYPVGRLDRNTTGVLLLTNDGELTKVLTHPKHNKKKIYHVQLDKALEKEDMDKISEGFELEDGFISADEISYVHDEDKRQIGIEIHSGKNRIIRRLFHHLDYKVMKLDRVYFAGLTKKGLSRGQWRFLNSKEVGTLKMSAYE